MNLHKIVLCGDAETSLKGAIPAPIAAALYTKCCSCHQEHMYVESLDDHKLIEKHPMAINIDNATVSIRDICEVSFCDHHVEVRRKNSSVPRRVLSAWLRSLRFVVLPPCHCDSYDVPFHGAHGGPPPSGAPCNACHCNPCACYGGPHFRQCNMCYCSPCICGPKPFHNTCTSCHCNPCVCHGGHHGHPSAGSHAAHAHHGVPENCVQYYVLDWPEGMYNKHN